MTLRAKFISTDGKEEWAAKVEMPSAAVFYPYFHFTASKEGEKKTSAIDPGRKYAAYSAGKKLAGFSPEKLCALERAFFPGRPDEYGYWTAKTNEGFFSGLGASGISGFAQDGIYRYALLKRDDIAVIVSFEKEGDIYKNAVLRAYLSDANSPLSDVSAELGRALEDSCISEDGIETKDAHFAYEKNHYGEKALEKKNFLECVETCTWNTSKVGDSDVREGPIFVLLKNCGYALSGAAKDASHWLVHRCGGFVMGDDYKSSDFREDTLFVIEDVEEYVFDGVTVLNVECETYAKDRDAGFEAFLKNLSSERFTKI